MVLSQNSPGGFSLHSVLNVTLDKSICQVTTFFNIPLLNFSNLVSLGKNMETVPGGVFGSAITFLKGILCHIANNRPVLELQIALLKH